MAMFYFRLKSDKKPDGTKISAVQHVEYINRVDNFSSQNQHQENNHFVGNLITSAEIKNACDGLNTLLYKTDFFGSIRNSYDGIFCAALPISKKLCSKPLFLTTSPFLSPINSHKMNSYVSRRLLLLIEKTSSPTAAKLSLNDQFPSHVIRLLMQNQSKMLPKSVAPFLEKHLKNHYYAYAIHDKIGMMSDGQRHPHVHIMFSERIIDDVEKTKERPAKFFFLYPARKKKDGSQPSFQEKWQRGAPKNRNWADKSFLAVLRADFAQIQNEVLAQNGFSIRVDHRSLQAQKEDAEKNGDSFLARLFNRIPEEYVGVISCLDDDNPKLQ